MNFIDILLIILISAAVICAIVVLKKSGGTGGCSCGCSGCTQSCDMRRSDPEEE